MGAQQLDRRCYVLLVADAVERVLGEPFVEQPHAVIDFCTTAGVASIQPFVVLRNTLFEERPLENVKYLTF